MQQSEVWFARNSSWSCVVYSCCSALTKESSLNKLNEYHFYCPVIWKHINEIRANLVPHL